MTSLFRLECKYVFIHLYCYWGLLNAFAGVLIKLSYCSGEHFSLKNPMILILNFHLWGSVFLYGISFFAYAKSLQTLPLNVAQPITTGGVVFFTALLSYFIFSEEINLYKIVGMFLILFGVVFVSWNA